MPTGIKFAFRRNAIRHVQHNGSGWRAVHRSGKAGIDGHGL